MQVNVWKLKMSYSLKRQPFRRNKKANQLNRIEKLIVEPKPKLIKPKVIQEIEQPQEIRRSTHERKSKIDDDYIY